CDGAVAPRGRHKGYTLARPHMSNVRLHTITPRSDMMNTSILASRATSLNAKVGAVALLVAALFTLLLSHFSAPLAPLRLLSLALAAFAVWCFCDEMGMRKPLN